MGEEGTGLHLNGSFMFVLKTIPTAASSFSSRKKALNVVPAKVFNKLRGSNS